jgi:hypothetical protein
LADRLRTDPNYYRAGKLKKLYGLSTEEYDRLLEGQGGTCAICSKPCPTGRRLAVDHAHDTGKVRGLLCANCNRGLGLFGEDMRVMTMAIQYLISA